MAYVLAIDDDPAYLRFIRVALSSTAHELAVTTSAPGGLRMIRERRPDMVLLDMNMPGMDGLGFLRRLSLMDIGAVPVIAVSGVKERDVIIEAGRRGITSYVVKDENLRKTLAARIEAQLDPWPGDTDAPNDADPTAN